MEISVEKIVEYYPDEYDFIHAWLFDDARTLYEPYKEMSAFEVFIGAVPDICIATENKAAVSNFVLETAGNIHNAGMYLEQEDIDNFKEASIASLSNGLVVAGIPFTIDEEGYSERFKQKVFYLLGAINTAMAYSVRSLQDIKGEEDENDSQSNS